MFALRTANVVLFSSTLVAGQEGQNPAKDTRTLKEKWEAYVDWIKNECGGDINDKLEFRFINAGEHWFRGIVVKEGQTVEKGENLFTVPWECSLSDDLYKKHLGFAYGPGTVERALWKAMGVAHLRKNTKILKPWFDLLPDTDYLPHFWKEEDLALLEGSFVYRKITNRYHSLENTFTRLENNTTMSKDGYFKMFGINRHEVLQGFALLASRSFSRGSSSYLPSGVDFFNQHDIGKEVTLKYHEDSQNTDFYYKDRSFKEGEQLYNNYGSANDWHHTFAVYGYIPFGVEPRHVHIDLENALYEEPAWNQQLKQKLTSTWSLPTDINVHPVAVESMSRSMKDGEWNALVLMSLKPEIFKQCDFVKRTVKSKNMLSGCGIKKGKELNAMVSEWLVNRMVIMLKRMSKGLKQEVSEDLTHMHKNQIATIHKYATMASEVSRKIISKLQPDFNFAALDEEEMKAEYDEATESEMELETSGLDVDVRDTVEAPHGSQEL